MTLDHRLCFSWTVNSKGDLRAKPSLAKMRTIHVFYYLLHVSLAETAEINVEGFEGGEVSFRCFHRLAYTYEKYFCKVSCKGDDILATVTAGGRTESERITLVDSGNGDFTVNFKHLQLLDSGSYWCAADRPGLDTFTSVYLTVHKVSTVAPVVTSAWTQNVVYSTTQQTTDIKTFKTTNLSMASNVTDVDGPTNRPSAMLYAVVGAIATLIILVLATLFRKRREISKPQHVCFFINNVRNTRKETDFETNHVQWDKILSSVNPHHYGQDPCTSARTKTDGSLRLPVYENITSIKEDTFIRDPPPIQQNQDAASRIYITLLPSAALETTADSSARTDSTKTTTSESTADPTPTAPHSLPTEENPRSVWFGLDLSQINQSSSSICFY